MTKPLILHRVVARGWKKKQFLPHDGEENSNSSKRKPNGLIALRLTIAALICLSTTAQAGSYSVSYSGGATTWATPGSRTGYPHSYGLGNDGYYGGGGMAVWGSSRGSASTGKAKCAGEITATFTWQPGGSPGEDPPPTKVVIAESANTSASSFASSAATAATTSTCSNSLGFPYTADQASGYGTAGTSNGTRYQIKDSPGASFTVMCSPTAEVEGTGVVSPITTNGGNVEAYYKATAIPLGIMLGGGIGPQNDKQYLIGQRVSATLATGGLTANSFNWTVNGGKPFKDWTADDNHTVLTPMSAENGNSLTFHFKEKENSTITTPVHLNVPAGSLPANGLDTTLTQQCTVEAPTYSFEAEMGSVQIYNNPLPAVWMRLWGATRVKPDGTSARNGVVWVGSVSTLAKYGAGGGWNFTQVVTPHRVRRLNGVMQKRASNDVLALDTLFPYAPEDSLYQSDGNTQFNGDSPGETWGEDAGTSYIEVSDTYATYILYMPPGDGGCYVPLAKTGWYWKGKAEPDSGLRWAVSDTDAGFSSYVDFPEHPIWHSNVESSSGWVNQ